MSSVVAIPAVGTKLSTTAVKAVVIMVEGRNLRISKIHKACRFDVCSYYKVVNLDNTNLVWPVHP